MDTLNTKKLAFFFVDLDESTVFKYGNCPMVWRNAFQSFYTDFHETLDRNVLGHEKFNENPFKYWKGLGDAVIYSCEYRDGEEFSLIVKLFQQTIKEFEPMMKEPFGLSLKSAVWFISLPSTNFIVKTPSGDDYIGPDMDVGFRLAHVAISERCFLAMDSVELLANSSSKENFQFIHLGWKRLKGIHFENQYPIFQVTHKDLKWDSRMLNEFKGTKGDYGSGVLTAQKSLDLIETYKNNLGYVDSKI